MNYTYNTTNLNTTSITALYNDINISMDGIPIYGFLLMLYIAVLVIYVKTDATRAHITASTVTSILSVLFAFAGWISFEIVLIPLGMLVIGLIVLGFTD